MTDDNAAKARALWNLGKDPTPPPNTPPATTPAGGDVQHAYAVSALNSEAQSVAAAPQGTRNAQLNASVFACARFVHNGTLTYQQVHDQLLNAALAAGLPRTEAERTIGSGFRGAAAKPRPDAPRGYTTATAPDVTEVQAAELQATTTLWDKRPILDHIRQYALARMCAPTAVLGVVLLRALQTIPPTVVLPPIIGGPGSLNLFCALVGPPGAGKGAAEATGAEAINLGDIYTATAGSGEGIAHQYAHREKGEVIMDRTAVLFTVPEVDTLAAIGSRQGATLMSQLRSAFSGEGLGYSYADQSRRLPIPRHSYRLGMLVGVQPEKAKILLDDADGGTPQRFIWLRATDPAITATPPEAPAPWPVPAIHWGQATTYEIRSGLRILPVPPEAAAQVREAHAARARGEGGALDGHAMFARLKIAQALAVLDGRPTMTLDDWHLAGDIMHLSDATRAASEAAIKASEQLRRRAAIEHAAEAAAEAEDRTWARGLDRVARTILRKLALADGEINSVELRRAVASRDRGRYDEALDALAEQGRIEVNETAAGPGGRIIKAVVRDAQ